ncbi:universal stress protein [Rubrobacter marinus]|uniref:universal stress protein n=1 Tax=Rubrobacter marinus TaxID=2653852 RepID=UPI00140BB172|nr:universal stress protein [Rubrobacter marinus]
MSQFPARILLATDGSEDARLAFRAATDLSREAGSELHPVHVVARLPHYVYPGVTPEVYALVVQEQDREGRELLDEELDRARGGGVEVAEAHLRRGSAADEVLDLAEEIGAGLIVMGSRGLGPVKRLVMGSVSEGVAHDAPCPVLVMRGDPDAWPPASIVLGDDGSEEAKEAGELAVAIGKLYGARGLLVRAYPELPEQDAEGRGFDARRVDDALRREERALEERAAELEGSVGVRPKVRISVGDPAGCIMEAAAEGDEGKTLVAVGSRGLDAVGRFRLGSVSTKVLHAAEGPVLIHPRAR